MFSKHMGKHKEGAWRFVKPPRKRGTSSARSLGVVVVVSELLGAGLGKEASRPLLGVTTGTRACDELQSWLCLFHYSCPPNMPSWENRT